MVERSLNGIWDFQWDDAPWQPLAVPGCWEMLGPKARSGPCSYRTTFDIEDHGGRWWLCFDAVSYRCTVVVNGVHVGEHLGLWDAFAFEITDAVAGRAQVEVLVHVEKPASLIDGPGSPSVPGRYPLPETLAGFLPYVWGHSFGGIWQNVTLRSTGRTAITDVQVRGDASGAVDLLLLLTDRTTAQLTIRAPDGGIVWTERLLDQREYRATVQIAEPRPWSPTDPALYELSVEVEDGDQRTVRFGCRTVGTSGTHITLNGAAVYPRMALSWGWYADALHSNPGPERVRADFARLRDLGYNGVKLCLWFPPQYYFDLADELGVLLWLEFPMWLPRPSAFFREQTPREYLRLAAQAMCHPSIILYTLGCELGGDVGGDILQPLFRQVKQMVGDALVRDNSGSGEAYGGLLDESAEFYDYHFYADIQFFRNLLDFWTPRWRPVLPWLFGEYCDSDTFRDLRPLQQDTPPWWIDDSPDANPKGARWQYDIVDQERRLRANGMWERGPEMERISHAQSLLHRKYTLEFTRTYEEIGGYVVTGEVDTPISTAGMIDDRGQLKFDSAAFRGFNGDTVVLVGWDKRRVWYAGGDRAAPWDTWCYYAGDLVRPHLLVSHYGAATPATVRWEAVWDDGSVIASGEKTVASLEPARVRELVIAAFTVPALRTPRRAVLRATLAADTWTTANEWDIWCFPLVGGTDAPLMLLDPAARLNERGSALPYALHPFDAGALDVPLLATAWSDDVERFIDAGGRVLVLLAKDEPSPAPVSMVPFWREAVKVIEPHPAWGDFPHRGSVGLQFYGCAPDCAMDTSALVGTVSPILRRLDARTMALHDYAMEWRHGAGRAILTTLRFEGGLGDQPVSLGYNTAAAYLLRCWLDWLREGA